MNHEADTNHSSIQSLFPSVFGHEFQEVIIMDLAILMLVAAIMLAVTRKLKQPMVIAYIIAGMIIGPHTPPFSLISQTDTLEVFAEIGVILLLFVIGMEFPIAKLKQVGGKASIIAAAEAFGTFVIGYIVVQQMGLALFDSLFLALSISVTSTVMVMRVLEELEMLREEESYLLLGVAKILSLYQCSQFCSPWRQLGIFL